MVWQGLKLKIQQHHLASSCWESSAGQSPKHLEKLLPQNVNVPQTLLNLLICSEMFFVASFTLRVSSPQPQSPNFVRKRLQLINLTIYKHKDMLLYSIVTNQTCLFSPALKSSRGPMISLISEYFKYGCYNVCLKGMYTQAHKRCVHIHTNTTGVFREHCTGQRQRTHWPLFGSYYSNANIYLLNSCSYI